MDHHHAPEPESINFIYHVNLIREKSASIAKIVGVAVLLAIIYCFTATKLYRAEATLMPLNNEETGGLSAMLTQFSSIASLAGAGGLKGSTPIQRLTALLASRTLAQKIVLKCDLQTVFDPKQQIKDPELRMESTIKKLSKRFDFREDKTDGTLKLSGEFEDAELAKKVVDGYIEELQNFINTNSFSLAKKKRLFVEHQLLQNKRELLEAGKQLNSFYREGKISSVMSKVDVPLDSYVAPDITLPLGDSTTPIETSTVVKNVPQQVYLEYLTKQLLVMTQMNALLSQQTEMAKIAESKDELSFQVIDSASSLKRHYKPRRKMIVISVFSASLIMSIWWIIFQDWYKREKARSWTSPVQ